MSRIPMMASNTNTNSSMYRQQMANPLAALYADEPDECRTDRKPHERSCTVEIEHPRRADADR